MFGFAKKAAKWLGSSATKAHKWVGKNLPSIDKIEKYAPMAGAAIAGGLAATGYGIPLAAAAIGAGRARVLGDVELGEGG